MLLSENRSAMVACAVLVCGFLGVAGRGYGQEHERAGRAIGKVSAVGKLIVMELDERALGRENLFDLQGRTLRFSPVTGGARPGEASSKKKADRAGATEYRVENVALQWDGDYGQEMKGPDATLHNFAFPFSGKNWDAVSVGITGAIRFGPGVPNTEAPWARSREVHDPGGVEIGRFDPLNEAAGSLVNTVPAICVFFKPRMTGNRYVKELADRVVVTWDVTEPWGNIQDFMWTKTVNRFQAVLYQSGAIEMSYKELAAKDAIVGVYPLIAGGKEKLLGEVKGEGKREGHAAVAPNLDLESVKLSVIDGVVLRVTFETAGPVLAAGDPGLADIGYSVRFAAQGASGAAGNASGAEAVWAIRGFVPRRRGGESRYVAFGPGVSRGVKTDGKTISIEGILPPGLRGASQIDVSAEAYGAGSEKPVTQIAAQMVALKGIRSPEAHLSSLTPNDGPYDLVYEAFHYYALPNLRDMACTVIKGLGDKFDFLAYYSDFRIDNQEAGTPSDGPLGAVGGAVTGIGAKQEGLAEYCSAGRFQWEFIQPVYVGANQMQEQPPADAPMGKETDITYYQKQLEEVGQGKMQPYMYAMSQIAHEMGHRWAAFVSAKIGDEAIPLGPVHWARGLQARVAFPYQRPTEASIMGGGVWQDNFDGTYTQLDDDYYVPATGWSYLDLYLMGLISPAEVPDFFLLRNLVPAGKDANGHPIFKADRIKVTIQDVIAAEGPRVPGVDKSQRQFNTGMVMVVQHGQKPSAKLVEETEGIREQWIKYFSITTGRRASMTAEVE